MKNISKIILASLLFGLPLQMCTNDPTDDCNCGQVQQFFDVKGMELLNLKSINNSFAIIEDNEIVQFENYDGLFVQFEVDYLSQHQHKSPVFSLTPAAYACSCRESGYGGSKFEKLTNISIITMNDFDETHLANQSINDLIGIQIYTGSNTLETLPVEEFLTTITENLESSGLKLYLNRKPVLNENFKVKVIVELSTGEVYEKTSSSFILQ